MSQPVGILDYGMGNLRSVRNAIISLGHETVVVATARDLESLRALIVPGVGAFAMAMENLRAKQLEGPLHAYIASGRPLLGICLGMQILATTGAEPNESPGLGVISGRVVRMPVGAGVRLPHVGWNNLEIVRPHPVLAKVKPNADFYFVHSYCFMADQPADTVATSTYDADFTCAVAKGNVIGTQFHPEKSQESGLRLLNSFCEWDGQC